MMLRGVLSDDDRAKLARMLEEGEATPAVPSWEEWGTSPEAIRNLHDAMATIDQQQ